MYVWGRPSIQEQRWWNFVGFRSAQDYIDSLGTCIATLAFLRAVA